MYGIQIWSPVDQAQLECEKLQKDNIVWFNLDLVYSRPGTAGVRETIKGQLCDIIQTWSLIDQAQQEYKKV